MRLHALLAEVWRKHERPEVRARVLERGAQREREHLARLLRVDDRVDEAARGGDSARRADARSRRASRRSTPATSAASVVPFFFAALERRAVHGLNRRLAFHHAHAPRRPAEDEVGIEALPRHRVVAGAGRVVHGEHDLRHARRRHRFDEARARADDAFVLGLGTDHEARDVLHEQQRHALPVAAVDEVRDLLGALGVDDAAEARLLARRGP